MRRPRGSTASVGRIVVVLLLLVACGTTRERGGGSAPSSVGERAPATLHVPGEFTSIQAALDHAVPGDLVLIAPGAYHEAVRVSTDRVVVRGLDRNTVVLDGQHRLDNGIVVNGDGVAVENLTVRGYRFNGIVFSAAYGDTSTYGTAEPLHGYRASYVTTYANGLYGVYAFGARGGLFEESFAGGHPDSGFYIGRCDPCDAVVRRVKAIGNVVGFQGTNASTNLFIVESEWRGNRVGIQPNSDAEEGNLPQHDATIVGNVVADNANPSTPPSSTGVFGYGIAVGGSSRNLIARNLVTGNANTGIALVADSKGFLASGNRVAENVLTGNGVDVEYLSPSGETRGNCFERNQLTTSFPAEIERMLPCAGQSGPVQAGTSRQRIAVPAGVRYQELPPPPPQPSMPDAAMAAPAPATGMPAVDVTTIPVPVAR